MLPQVTTRHAALQRKSVSYRILLVEDDAEIAEFVAQGLQEEGLTRATLPPIVFQVSPGGIVSSRQEFAVETRIECKVRSVFLFGEPAHSKNLQFRGEGARQVEAHKDQQSAG